MIACVLLTAGIGLLPAALPQACDAARARGPAAGQEPSASAPAPSPPATTLVFGSDAAIIINPIRADRVAQFEAVLARLREALRRSADPLRQQQAESWKVLKANEPGPDGAVLYFFIIDPPVPGADYTVSHILAEAFPDEVDALWTALRDSYLAAMHLLTLQAVADPPAAGTPGN